VYNDLNSGEGIIMSAEITKIAVFKGRNIRRVLVNDEWWFSVVDIVAVLTDSDNPRDYWYKMKVRETEEAKV
jgi:prophage antirepressor-like protein